MMDIYNEKKSLFLGWPAAAGVWRLMGPEQLAQLIETQAPALVLYARQWCAAPEDVVQEAFVKLAVQQRPPDNPVAWLFRVVRNGAISAARAAQRRRWHESRASRQTEPWFQPSEEGALDAAEATRRLQELPLEQREIIVAHLWGGLTFEQIARVVGCSSSTAHRRYLDGLTVLRDKLGVLCPIHANKRT
jgi:RNA polymerase sigma-70 factor (ECF subfamily)